MASRMVRKEAEALIEEAADRAEKPSLGKAIKGLFSSKYDKDGMLILKEEHFIYENRYQINSWLDGTGLLIARASLCQE